MQTTQQKSILSSVGRLRWNSGSTAHISEYSPKRW